MVCESLYRSTQAETSQDSFSEVLETEPQNTYLLQFLMETVCLEQFFLLDVLLKKETVLLHLKMPSIRSLSWR